MPKALRSPAVADHPPSGLQSGRNDYVADADAAARELLIYLLNASLATELVCVLRFRLIHYKAMSLSEHTTERDFLQHSNQEQTHADAIAERITQLGGTPDFSPVGLVARSYVEYIEEDTLDGMIRENLLAERITIDKYQALIRYVGERDADTRRMMENILAMEQGHVSALERWTAEVDPAQSQTAQTHGGS